MKNSQDRILVVDGIPEYLDVIGVILPEEYAVDKALSLEEAKEKIKENPPDLAIIDVRLNEEDETNKEGLELLRWIKENYPSIKVIMISAYREFEFRTESLALGAEFFLEKPLNPETLAEAVKNALGRGK